MARDIRIHVWRSYQSQEGVGEEERRRCADCPMWSRVHKRHAWAGAILISKVLVKSEWVGQHVIDPVAPVKSYPGVISIHQICLENILWVLPLTRSRQNNNSLTHIGSSALLRARIVICLSVPWTCAKTKHFSFIDFVVAHFGRGTSFSQMPSKISSSLI